MARYKRYGVVVRGKEHPSFELMCGAELQEEVNFSAIVPFRPGYSTLDISRSSRDQMPTLFDQPHWDSASAQAAYHTKASIVRAHYQGT
jgi:hypothetical protein